MQTIEVVWQRLLSLKGTTCDRCADTESALQQAIETLSAALAPLGIEVVLRRKALTMDEFNLDPTASNRIWIGGRALEEWLDAQTGSSACCSVCGNAFCRTLECDHATYEAIPARLIIKAGLLAATKVI